MVTLYRVIETLAGSVSTLHEIDPLFSAELEIKVPNHDGLFRGPVTFFEALGWRGLGFYLKVARTLLVSKTKLWYDPLGDHLSP